MTDFITADSIYGHYSMEATSKVDESGALLMGHIIREHDRYGAVVSEKTVYNCRVFGMPTKDLVILAQQTGLPVQPNGNR